MISDTDKQDTENRNSLAHLASITMESSGSDASFDNLRQSQEQLQTSEVNDSIAEEDAAGASSIAEEDAAEASSIADASVDSASESDLQASKAIDEDDANASFASQSQSGEYDNLAMSQSQLLAVNPVDLDDQEDEMIRILAGQLTRECVVVPLELQRWNDDCETFDLRRASDAISTGKIDHGEF